MLTEKYYFSQKNNQKYVGASQYKSFLKCEAAMLAELNGEYEKPKSDALLQGSYIDAYFTGNLEKFRLKNPEIFKKDGTLKASFEHLNYVIQRLSEQPFMLSLLSGKHQKIFTGEINSVPVKIKIDSFLPSQAIVDLKCMKDFEPVYVPEKGKLPWFEAWGYDLQGAIYQEIVRQNTGEELPFILVAVTKEKEPDFDVIQIDQEILDFELDKFSKDIVRLDAVKKGLIEPERCGQCDYCKKIKIISKIRKSGDFYFE